MSLFQFRREVDDFYAAFLNRLCPPLLRPHAYTKKAKGQLFFKITSSACLWLYAQVAGNDVADF
jgi:hypothetical protein